MFVIRPDGTLAYEGAIDSKPSARVPDIDTATNYVRAALTSVASSKPYGCSVKYE